MRPSVFDSPCCRLPSFDTQFPLRSEHSRLIYWVTTPTPPSIAVPSRPVTFTNNTPRQLHRLMRQPTGGPAMKTMKWAVSPRCTLTPDGNSFCVLYCGQVGTFTKWYRCIIANHGNLPHKKDELDRTSRSSLSTSKSWAIHQSSNCETESYLRAEPTTTAKERWGESARANSHTTGKRETQAPVDGPAEVW